MGNCFRKKQSTSEIAPSSSFQNFSTKKPLVYLHGDSSNSVSHYLRFALHYKPITLRFIHSETSSFTLRFESPASEAVSGSAETVIRFVESKFPQPAILRSETRTAFEIEEVVVVRRMVELQHRSLTWHLERVTRWGKDMTTRGGREVVDPKVGTPRMEVVKLGKSYGKLLEVLLEHAQMEERILFPLLDAADPGMCRCVTEEHARDLPIMNGIKEDIKSIGVMLTGTSTHKEALCSLSARFNTLQDNCRDHFNEEERNLFPLLEAAELTEWKQRKTVEGCIDVMQGTHSHFFSFFIQGLLPHEAIEYLDLMMTCINKERVSSMLHLLVD
ncbi:uncharacterized protein LOC141647925 [Silene latifolia]|uniref:uncharacterized protein LOC141647925 n=1 Tax=Silene latifolia TaxID=37657 RepID=UPI003D7847C1